MEKEMKILANRKRAMMAFNVQSLFQIEALYVISKNRNVPIIIQFSAKFVPYFEAHYGFDFLIKKYQNELFFFHLDHCLDEDLIKFCVNKGFASVMFDGSSLPIEENVRITNNIYKYTSSKGTLLEAELGAITGVEDGFGSDTSAGYYSNKELLYFHENAHYDLLALAIGNAHGFYHGTDDVKVEKLADAKSVIGPQYFVLHGGTGMPDEMIQEAISYGVVKINVSTALKLRHFEIMQKFVETNKIYDELKFSAFFNEEITTFFESFILKFTV